MDGRTEWMDGHIDNAKELDDNQPSHPHLVVKLKMAIRTG